MLLWFLRTQSKDIFGQDVSSLVITHHEEQISRLIFGDSWHINLINFAAQTLHHLSSYPLLQLLKLHPIIFPSRVSEEPLPQPAALVFTDGSSNSTAVKTVNQKGHSWANQEASVQSGVRCCNWLFSHPVNEDLNLYSNWQYNVRLLPLGQLLRPLGKPYFYRI